MCKTLILRLFLNDRDFTIKQAIGNELNREGHIATQWGFMVPGDSRPRQTKPKKAERVDILGFEIASNRNLPVPVVKICKFSGEM